MLIINNACLLDTRGTENNENDAWCPFFALCITEHREQSLPPGPMQIKHWVTAGKSNADPSLHWMGLSLQLASLRNPCLFFIPVVLHLRETPPSCEFKLGGAWENFTLAVNLKHQLPKILPVLLIAFFSALSCCYYCCKCSCCCFPLSSRCSATHAHYLRAWFCPACPAIPFPDIILLNSGKLCRTHPCPSWLTLARSITCGGKLVMHSDSWG